MRVEEGFYDAVCTGEVQFGDSDKGGQLAVELSIPSLENTTVTSVLYFSPAAKPYSVAKLKACGWDGEADDIGASVKGNPVRIGVRYEQWEGKEQMRVNIFDDTARRFRFKKTMSDSAKANFMADIKSKVPGQAGGYPADWDQTSGKRRTFEG